MHLPCKDGRTTFVSFSGIDGAGKSTQIEALCAWLTEAGLRVRVIRFWDDIARLKQIRETTGHRIFKGDKGVGTPSAPINRRDKNVRSWLMTGVRLFIYILDAISLRGAIGKASTSGTDLVVFDRYIYDELANLTLSGPAIRAYVRLLVKFVPKPHISFLLDADPVKARARKPEYPLDFLSINRESYLALSELVVGMTVVAPMPMDKVERTILCHTLRELPFPATRRWDADGSISARVGNKPAMLDCAQTSPAVTKSTLP